jgi:hypothetical protein
MCALGNPVSHVDGRLTQGVKYRFGIDATNAVLFEQSLDGRPPEIFRLIGRWRLAPKLQQPTRRHVIGELKYLRVIPPELVMEGNYSPPFWEILLDTVTAESPTGEG